MWGPAKVISYAGKYDTYRKGEPGVGRPASPRSGSRHHCRLGFAGILSIVLRRLAEGIVIERQVVLWLCVNRWGNCIPASEPFRGLDSLSRCVREIICFWSC